MKKNNQSSVSRRQFVGQTTKAFAGFLENRNMVVNIRKSRGKDIDAACGQLAGYELKIKN